MGPLCPSCSTPTWLIKMWKKISLSLRILRKAKKRFAKKYPAEDWNNYQEKLDAILADQSFWRSASKSVAVFVTAQDTWVHRLQIPIDDQYYVGIRLMS